MQRTKHQVAGFRGGHGQAYGFQIAHFTDQDHVRVFTQGTTQSILERQGMRADFALIDQTLFAFMHEFDWVFHGQDVAQFFLVTLVDHRSQRSGFSRAGWSRNKHQAARIIANGLENFGGLQIFQRQYLGGNGTHYCTRTAVMDKGVDAKTCKSGNLEGEVDLLVLLVSLALTVVHDVIYQGVHILVLQRRQVDPAYVAMHTNHRRQAGGKMQIGRFVFDAKSKQFGDIHYNRPGLMRWP